MSIHRDGPPKRNERFSITELNPQPPTVTIPDLVLSRRNTATMRSVAKYAENAQPRPIGDDVDLVLIVRGRKPVASQLLLRNLQFGPELLMFGPAPETPAFGKQMRIVNLTERAHMISATGGGKINGISESLVLKGLGASVELVESAGTWIMVAAHQAELVNQQQ